MSRTTCNDLMFRFCVVAEYELPITEQTRPPHVEQLQITLNFNKCVSLNSSYNLQNHEAIFSNSIMHTIVAVSYSCCCLTHFVASPSLQSQPIHSS